MTCRWICFCRGDRCQEIYDWGLENIFVLKYDGKLASLYIFLKTERGKYISAPENWNFEINLEKVLEINLEISEF